MSDFTFLTEEQVFGDKQLDILKKYSTKAAITDFSILLGSYVSSNVYTSEENTLKNKEKYLKQENLKKNIQVKL